MKAVHGAAAVAIATLLAQSAAQASASQSTGVFHSFGGRALTATHALSLRNSFALGLADSRMPMHVAVALQMRDKAGAIALVRHETTPGDPLFGATVPSAWYTARFNPTPGQAAAVAQYMAQNGFRNVTIEPNNLFVSADGTVASVASAFNTRIGIYRQFNHTVYANVDAATVPAALRGVVLSVLGLSNAGQMRPADDMHIYAPKPCDLNTQQLCILNSYGPQDFQNFYDAAGGPTGWGLKIAVFAEGNVTQVLTDLRTYELNFGLPQVAYSVRRVGIPSPDLAGLDEWDLDTQSSTGIAAQIGHLYVYDTTSLSDSDTALEFSKFVTDNVAKLGNASFGLCESFASLDGSEVADDQTFLQGAAQGQTVFSSTGDNGNGCPVIAATGVPGTGVPENSYPATSPYVVGVGGTTIVSNVKGGTYNSEVTWMGTGGGVSQTESSPYWQAGPVNAVYVKAGRTIPDVSMDADPDTGALIYVNGVATGIGGTSLSSPLAMGVSARFVGARKGRLPFLAPLFYQAWEAFVPNCTPTTCVPPAPAPGATTQLIGGFHDILLGSNGGPYGTLPGYDLETGLGTFDIAQMQLAIKKVVGY